MTQQQLADGWYRTINKQFGEDDFDKVVDGCCDFGAGASVEFCLSNGYTFEPAVVMTKAEYDELAAKVAELEAENNQMYEQVRVLPFEWGIKLRQHKERIAELEEGEAEWKRIARINGEHVMLLQSEIEQLRAQLAQTQTWQPVEEDYWGHFNVERKGTVVSVHLDSGFERDKGYLIVPLPPTVKVCRLADAAQDAQEGGDSDGSAYVG